VFEGFQCAVAGLQQSLIRTVISNEALLWLWVVILNAMGPPGGARQTAGAPPKTRSQLMKPFIAVCVCDKHSRVLATICRAEMDLAEISARDDRHQTN